MPLFFIHADNKIPQVVEAANIEDVCAMFPHNVIIDCEDTIALITTAEGTLYLVELDQ